MEVAENHQGRRLKELIGEIVLATQGIECQLKFLNPYMGKDEQEVALKRVKNKNHKQQTFGQLVGAFLKNSKFDSASSEERLEHLIKVRNQLIHQFSEIYGTQIESGNIDTVISDLETHLKNINYFKSALTQVALLLAELLCDSSMDTSPELDQLRKMIEELKLRVSS